MGWNYIRIWHAVHRKRIIFFVNITYVSFYKPSWWQIEGWLKASWIVQSFSIRFDDLNLLKFDCELRDIFYWKTMRVQSYSELLSQCILCLRVPDNLQSTFISGAIVEEEARYCRLIKDHDTFEAWNQEPKKTTNERVCMEGLEHRYSLKPHGWKGVMNNTVLDWQCLCIH